MPILVPLLDNFGDKISGLFDKLLPIQNLVLKLPGICCVLAFLILELLFLLMLLRRQHRDSVVIGVVSQNIAHQEFYLLRRLLLYLTARRQKR